eukprot:TRINITY_DN113581_c0_g1_i1.p1 TRINITY_DN113581_c0_g1~~TRINITY_DN113581_c0_g1_i1.p1  ORF type:complete len:306 (-),score=64.51 TRINITY_DN113581_c0_g1_i1:166-1083(-)
MEWTMSNLLLRRADGTEVETQMDPHKTIGELATEICPPSARFIETYDQNQLKVVMWQEQEGNDVTLLRDATRMGQLQQGLPVHFALNEITGDERARLEVYSLVGRAGEQFQEIRKGVLDSLKTRDGEGIDSKATRLQEKAAWMKNDLNKTLQKKIVKHCKFFCRFFCDALHDIDVIVAPVHSAELRKELFAAGYEGLQKELEAQLQSLESGRMKLLELYRRALLVARADDDTAKISAMLTLLTESVLEDFVQAAFRCAGGDNPDADEFVELLDALLELLHASKSYEEFKSKLDEDGFLNACPHRN